ncbi:hypothetical protein D3C72_1703250 [compost metagenome]
MLVQRRGEDRRGAHMQGEMLVEDIGIEGLCAVLQKDGSIVDEQTDRSERSGGVRQQPGRGVEVPQVGLQCGRPSAQTTNLAGKALRFVPRVVRMHCDGKTVAGQVESNCAPKSLCRAGDEGRLRDVVFHSDLTWFYAVMLGI